MADSIEKILYQMASSIDKLTQEIDSIKRGNINNFVSNHVPVFTMLPASFFQGGATITMPSPAPQTPTYSTDAPVYHQPPAPREEPQITSFDDIIEQSTADDGRLYREMAFKRQRLTAEQEEIKKELEKYDSENVLSGDSVNKEEERDELVDEISDALEVVDVKKAEYENNVQQMDFDPVFNSMSKSEIASLKKSLWEEAESELVEPSEQDIEDRYNELLSAWREKRTKEIEIQDKKIIKKLEERGLLNNEFVQ